MPIHLAQILPPEASTAKAAPRFPAKLPPMPQHQSRPRPLDGAKDGTTFQVKP
jgi:hypothetical protein